MLVPTLELLREASRLRYGVVAFNVIGLEHAEAIVLGAEHERAPVILQISQNAISYRGGAVEPIGRACVEIACSARVPVALHLDHATSADLCERAHAVGFNSIMFDASSMPYLDNVRVTASQSAWAHDRGMGIEGELGIVGGKNGMVTSEAGMTDPALAARYIEDTGVDTLAVAVGTEHGMIDTRARIDLDRVARLRELVNVPLVLHGSSGVPDGDLAEAVRLGITKVNIATQSNKAFTGAVRSYLASDAAVVDPRRYGQAGRAAMIDVVRERCRIVGASGRAS